MVYDGNGHVRNQFKTIKQPQSKPSLMFCNLYSGFYGNSSDLLMQTCQSVEFHFSCRLLTGCRRKVDSLSLVEEDWSSSDIQLIRIQDVCGKHEPHLHVNLLLLLEERSEVSRASYQESLATPLSDWLLRYLRLVFPPTQACCYFG